MDAVVEVIVAIGVVGFVIYQQLAGQTLRGKRVVLLPAVLTLVGVNDLRGGGKPLQTADIACLVISCAAAVVIGLAFGAIMLLEARDGVLWAKMPVKGLWLWLALVASRGVMYLVAAGLHAHVAQAGAPILLTLGLNRLAQAAVVVPRALSMGIPFAPEKDGKAFLSGVLGGPGAPSGPFASQSRQQYPPRFPQQQPQPYSQPFTDHQDDEFPGAAPYGDGRGVSDRPGSGPVDLSTFGGRARQGSSDR